MKKVFLSLAVVAALTVVSCKNNAEADAAAADSAATEAVDSAAAATEEVVDSAAATVDSAAATATEAVKDAAAAGAEKAVDAAADAAKAAVKKDQAMLEKGEAEIKATDEYKTIEGYKCRKYIYENDKYISELWVTNDNKLDYVKMNNALFNVFANSKDPNQNAYYKAGMKGFTIQTHMMPKDKRMQECIMTMKDIKLGSVPAEMFSTAGYEITDMPSIRNMWDSFKEEN